MFGKLFFETRHFCGSSELPCTLEVASLIRSMVKFFVLIFPIFSGSPVFSIRTNLCQARTVFLNMRRVVRKPTFYICENKDADQLRGNREAYQRLCFRYTDSTISLLPKYEISSLQPSSVAVQPGLCGTWSETQKTGFLITRLI